MSELWASCCLFEPEERELLRRRGHSASVVSRSAARWVALLFGGYGGRMRLDDLMEVVIEEKGFFQAETLPLFVARAARVDPNEGPRPCGREKHASAHTLDGALFVCFGRRSPRDALGDAWLFSNNEWTKVEAAGQWPRGRWSHTATAIGSRVVVVGGRDHIGPLSDSLYVLESGIGWTSHDCEPLDAHVAVYDEYIGRLVVFGGTSGERREGKVYLEENLSMKLCPLLERDRGSAAARLDRDHTLVVGTFSCGHGVDATPKRNDLNVSFFDDKNARTWPRVYYSSKISPFPIHAQALHLDDGLVLLLGGGAPCFAFGPVFGETLILLSTQRKKKYRTKL